MKLKNIYVLVKDIKRAITFYTNVLSFQLYREQERYTILKLDDVWFGLLNEKFDNNPRYGNNCIPVFEVDDVSAEYERLKQLGVKFVSELVELPDFTFFQFYDSEGNILEIYQEK